MFGVYKDDSWSLLNGNVIGKTEQITDGVSRQIWGYKAPEDKAWSSKRDGELRAQIHWGKSQYIAAYCAENEDSI